MGEGEFIVFIVDLNRHGRNLLEGIYGDIGNAIFGHERRIGGDGFSLYVECHRERDRLRVGGCGQADGDEEG